ncbi:hypothetical protein QYM36_005885 [Artemia franciscana]|uniref:Cuticle protein n=1 Tax=Artemia franciscana TaxID=6661 RepID=A0AA88HX30_ARTSF|nr:hypothetical protein QYM36_005885 [Artemia franciscana]
MVHLFQVFIISVLCAVAFSQDYPAKPAYPAQGGGYKQPAYEPGMPYNFNYAVQDDYSYNNFAQQESSDGKITSGQYKVLLPDGRTQIVTYKADDYTGFVSDVQYEGVAKYPEYKPSGYQAGAAPYPAKQNYQPKY